MYCSAQDTVEHPPRPDRNGVTNTGPYDYGGMGPAATPDVVAAALLKVAKPIPPGPFAPSWESIAKNYKTPSWFEDAKFGIFMHWGVFSVAAHHNEWYEKHMYGADAQWHAEHFGPQEKFGYKDLIPLFTAAKWDPDAWAALFKKAGARVVMEMGEHHDNFAEWDSDVTPFNARKMGPHRDLVGDLSAAVRKQGMRVAISNHGVENFTFIAPTHELRERLEAAHTDLFDPQWAAFYNVADRSDAALTRFLTNWVDRNDELIDKYRPDILWFDNGANLRVLDPLKLRVAAYYYNRAAQWKRGVVINYKNKSFPEHAAVLDIERGQLGEIRPVFWQTDTSISVKSWGYIENDTFKPAGSLVDQLVDIVSKNGALLLNVGPRSDGTIPEQAAQILLDIGKWLDTNGEAIYAARPWKIYGEGPTKVVEGSFKDTETKGFKGSDIRFTTKGHTLYAIALAWPESGKLVVNSLGTGSNLRTTPVKSVELLGSKAKLKWRQDSQSLTVELPPQKPGDYAFAFKIE